MQPNGMWAAQTMNITSKNLLRSCETLATKRFECEHTRQLHIDELRGYRRGIMRLLRHHYSYDTNTDYLWLCAYADLRNCLHPLADVDVNCPVMDIERLYVSACAIHLYRKLFRNDHGLTVSRIRASFLTARRRRARYRCRITPIVAAANSVTRRSSGGGECPDRSPMRCTDAASPLRR